MYSYVTIAKTVKDPLDTRVTTDRSSDGTYGLWLWLGDLVSVWLCEKDALDLVSRMDDALDALAYEKRTDARREEDALVV